jgi:hypothetical protein
VYKRQPPDNPHAVRALESILQGIKDGEQLFRNLDCEYVEEYVLFTFDEEPQPAGMVKEEKRVAHVVLQSDRFYFKETVACECTRGVGTAVRLYMSDGKVTRGVQTNTGTQGQGSFATISDERPVVSWMMTPLNFGIRPCEEPLSASLEKVMRHETASGKVTTSVMMDEDEEVDGIPCVKIRFRTVDSERLAPLRVVEDIIWLAAQAHYLPVKNNWLWRKHEQGLPDAITLTSDWREIEPGVLVPFKSIRTLYKDGKNGVRIPNARTTTTISRISLRPAYDSQFFSDVVIPKGSIVYEEKQGELVASYIEGQEDPRSPGVDWRVACWVFIVGGLVFMLAVAWKTRRRLIGVIWKQTAQ